MLQVAVPVNTASVYNNKKIPYRIDRLLFSINPLCMKASRTCGGRKWLSEAVRIAIQAAGIVDELYDPRRNQIQPHTANARSAVRRTKIMAENLERSMSGKCPVKKGPVLEFADMLRADNLNALMYDSGPPVDHCTVAQLHAQETPVLDIPDMPDTLDATHGDMSDGEYLHSAELDVACTQLTGNMPYDEEILFIK